MKEGILRPFVPPAGDRAICSLHKQVTKCQTTDDGKGGVKCIGDSCLTAPAAAAAAVVAADNDKQNPVSGNSVSSAPASDCSVGTQTADQGSDQEVARAVKYCRYHANGTCRNKRCRFEHYCAFCHGEADGCPNLAGGWGSFHLFQNNVRENGQKSASDQKGSESWSNKRRRW